MMTELLKPIVDDLWKSPFGRKVHILSEGIAWGMCILWLLERWPIIQLDFLGRAPLLYEAFHIVGDTEFLIATWVVYIIPVTIANNLWRCEKIQNVGLLRFNIVDIASGLYVIIYGAYFVEHILLFARGMSLSIVANGVVFFSMIWLVNNIGYRINRDNEILLKGTY